MLTRNINFVGLLLSPFEENLQSNACMKSAFLEATGVFIRCRNYQIVIC